LHFCVTTEAYIVNENVRQRLITRLPIDKIAIAKLQHFPKKATLHYYIVKCLSG